MLTRGPLLAVSEREREGEAGPLDARWAARAEAGLQARLRAGERWRGQRPAWPVGRGKEADRLG
jgi:hypothetical protein